MAGEPPPPGFSLFLRLLSSNWSWGRLTLVLPDGTRRRLEARHAGHEAVLEIRSYRFAGRVLRGGDIGFAEGYMAGEWDSPDLAILLEALANNYDHIRRLFDGNPLVNAVNWLGHRLNRNSRRGSRRNIHAHYDLGNAFYASWLDETMTYSSARFERPSQPLAEAQRAKYAALAQRMRLQAGHSVLEIGCGWGGFAEFAAGEVGATVTGITISREQYDFARRRLFEAGLAGKATIELVDYRDVQGQFDRVASIEMFEAVGREYWPTYFSKVRSVLKPGGVAGLQVITIRDDLFDDYEARTDFIQKYVFPGGTLPSERQLAPVVSAAGLHWREVDRFGPDYGRTLSCWSRCFERAWPVIRRVSPRFDERFRRLWLFYLAYCEAGFQSGRTDVLQLTLGRP
ncbi:cyclopropane-fatty-acyl-phospholipid synthase family protein [Brevundimonas sp.]|uniref:cyclopropane-fatty-acyl-phospholipid synthase family protein n=1 Tax=Brevundimonas sp. TaxID=1871086 RepID=UPI002D35B660|nr:cyclopropane-fatty-acyl-phospholipid synthase family protein [Brevundimonas sp.]HYD27270.1 cyclopropane-fatty-acyl-phospholipid synthase family protein [Brevundimonas sp.]